MDTSMSKGPFLVGEIVRVIPAGVARSCRHHKGGGCPAGMAGSDVPSEGLGGRREGCQRTRLQLWGQGPLLNGGPQVRGGAASGIWLVMWTGVRVSGASPDACTDAAQGAGARGTGASWGGLESTEEEGAGLPPTLRLCPGIFSCWFLHRPGPSSPWLMLLAAAGLDTTSLVLRLLSRKQCRVNNNNNKYNII